MSFSVLVLSLAKVAATTSTSTHACVYECVLCLCACVFVSCVSVCVYVSCLCVKFLFVCLCVLVCASVSVH